MELEEELKVVGNSLKSLEVSEEKVCMISNTWSGNRKCVGLALAGDPFVSKTDYKPIVGFIRPSFGLSVSLKKNPSSPFVF
jgi:hypothetical protein